MFTSASSFFQNTGAVAGTFTAVGLVVIVILGLLFRSLSQRKRKLQDNMDDVYFEKYGEHEGHEDPEFGNNGGDSAMDMTQPAEASAYPDRDVHFGPGDYSQAAYPSLPQINVEPAYNNDYAGQGGEYHAQGGEYHGQSNEYHGQSNEYQGQSNEYQGQSNDYHGQGNNYPGQGYIDYPPGMQPEYPPGTYPQQEAYNPYYDQQQQGQYPQPSTSPNHPYGNPVNAMRGTGAPPISYQ